MTTTGSPTPTRSAARSLVAGGAGLVLAIMVVNGVNYGLNVLLANAVSASLFGDISLMVTILLITGILASTLQLATSVAVLDRPHEGRNTVASMRLLANRLGVLGGLALAVTSPLAAELLQVENTWALFVMAIGFPAHLQLAVERGRLQGEMKLGRMAVTFIAEGATRFAATLIALALFPNLLTLTIALNVGFIGAYLLCRPRVGTWAWCDLSNPAGHPPVRSVGIAVVAATLLMNLDLVVAKSVFDPAAAGSFAALALGGRIVFFASWTLQQALLPLVTATHAGGTATLSAAARRNLFLVVNSIVCAILVAGAWLWADLWVSLAFGGRFSGIVPLFGPYAFGTALISILSAFVLIRSTDGDDRPGVLLIAGSAILVAILIRDSASLSDFVAARQIVLVSFVALSLMFRQFPLLASQRITGCCRRVLQGVFS